MLAQHQHAREITCPFQHYLINTDDICGLHDGQFYTENTYSCSICQENLSAEEAPSNHCMICKFDLCPGCYKEQRTIQISCSKDHPLFKVSPKKFYRQYPDQKVYCDFCSASIEKSALSAASCRICEYDLCLGCLILAQSEIEPEIPETQVIIKEDLNPLKTEYINIDVLRISIFGARTKR